MGESNIGVVLSNDQISIMCGLVGAKWCPGMAQAEDGAIDADAAMRGLEHEGFVTIIGDTAAVDCKMANVMKIMLGCAWLLKVTWAESEIIWYFMDVASVTAERTGSGYMLMAHRTWEGARNRISERASADSEAAAMCGYKLQKPDGTEASGNMEIGELLRMTPAKWAEMRGVKR